MVLLKSFFKFIVNPLAIVFLLLLLAYLVIVFFWKGIVRLDEYFWKTLADFEDILGDSWLGQKLGNLLDGIASIFD